MKWTPWAGIAFFLLLAPLSLKAEILTLYSDNGVPASGAAFPVITYCGMGQNPTFCGYRGNATEILAPEGYESFITTATNQSSGGFIGWGFDYGAPQNLSRFTTGSFRFWIRSNSGNLKVELRDSNANLVFQEFISNWGWTPALANQWVQYNIPFSGHLSGTGLSQVVNPFLFTSLSFPAVFFVDNVRYVTSDVSLPYFNVSLKNRSNDSVASQITWNNAPAGSGWTLADQYIQLTIDADTSAWGVQIYSENTAPGANPRYSGAVSSNTPTGGLVNVANTTQVLPLAWEIMAVTSSTLVAQEPNSCPANGLGCLWSYMADAAVFNQGNPSVFNGAPYITVKNNLGIHYAQGAALDATQFGAANPPNVIYLEANLNNALGNSTYRTSALRVEFFQQ